MAYTRGWALGSAALAALVTAACATTGDGSRKQPAGQGGVGGAGGSSTGGTSGTGGSAAGGAGGSAAGGAGGSAAGGAGGSAAGGAGGAAGGGTGGAAGGGTGGGAGAAGSAGASGSAGSSGTAGAGGGAGSGGGAGTGGSAGASGSSGASGSGGSGGDTTPPDVASTTPAGGTDAIIKGTTVAVTFTEAINTSTISANTTDTTCSGAIQVSADNFVTCVRMSAAPVASNGNRTFTVSPLGGLASATSYRVRVTTAVQDLAGNPMTSQFTTPSGFLTRYCHTITIDGTNDFTTDEMFVTTSASYLAYVAWDDTSLFLGWKGPDVAGGSATRFALAYLGGAGGSTTGVMYNTQTATLPFSAAHHARWKADNSFSSLMSFSGSWTEVAPFPGSVFQTGDFVEMSLPLSSIGSPTSLEVAMAMLNEQGGVEATFAGMPVATFVDGYNPTFTKYFDFDLQGSVVPNAHPVLP